MAWAGGELAYKPLEGRLVEVHPPASAGLPPDAQEEGQGEGPGAAPAAPTGRYGRCLRWDTAEQRYVVRTFEDEVVRVPEDCLRELAPSAPEEGGFDVAWPFGRAEGEGGEEEPEEDLYAFMDTVAQCLASRGYCVVQMFGGPALREAAATEALAKPPFEGLRAEIEEAYLGTQNLTQCGVLEADDPEKAPEDTLSRCDRDVSTMGSLVSPMLEQLFGLEVVDRSNALVRTPFVDGRLLRAPELEEGDLVDQLVESFVGWVLRRKLCLIYLIENDGGLLELHPKEHLGMPTIKLPLHRSRMVLFRHDLMGYSYRPEGESLALQAWLLEAPRCIEFRQLPLPPGMQGVERVHMTAANERFPANCEGCDMTWALFCAGTDAQVEVPFARFDKDLYVMHDRDAILYGKAYVMHGAFVSDEQAHEFDNEFFGYSQDEASAMGPAQRWILEVAYETLHKAGWSRDELPGQRIGTFIGDSGSDWNDVYWAANQYQISNNNMCITVCRLAHVFGLTGPTMSCDTACSASLVAANAAAHMMRTWTYRKGDAAPVIYNERPPLNKALCMGILAMVHPSGWIGECAATMLSFRGRCLTFDSSADGFIRGEGTCCTYLETQHDEAVAAARSLAVIMGTCANQDGRSASLTAPHGPSQQECIRQCLREAGLRPQDVIAAECHGTGTSLGDPIEVGAVRGVMMNNRDCPITHCTAKANVGHEEANAGICGLIKIVLMLNAAAVTPNPHLRALNAHLDVNGYPVLFNTELRATHFPDQVFGVSSFGFGGTNARAECWADAEKGSSANGARTLLSKDEAIEWITKVVGNAGTPKEMEGFLLDHKPGH